MMLPRRHSMRPSHFLAILMAVTVPAYLLSITFLFQPGSHHAAGPAVGESIASPAQDSASVQVVRINSTGDTPVAAPPVPDRAERVAAVRRRMKFAQHFTHLPTTCTPAPAAAKLLVFNRVYSTESSLLVNALHHLAFSLKFRLARVQFNGNVRTRMREAASREQLVNALSYNRFGSLPAEHFDVSVEGARRAKRVVVHEHVPFIDFEEFGFPQPVSITVIRDPLARHAAQFASNRDSLTKPDSCLWPGATLGDCLTRVRSGACPANACGMGNLQTSFLCGSAPACRRAGSTEALQLALRHMHDKFALVGVIDDPSTFTLLETLLPRWFKGLTERGEALLAATSGDDKHLGSVMMDAALHVDPHKSAVLRLSPENYDKLKELNANDIVLVDAATQLLARRMDSCARAHAKESAELLAAQGVDTGSGGVLHDDL